jgi:hypothetical protein
MIHVNIYEISPAGEETLTGSAIPLADVLPELDERIEAVNALQSAGRFWGGGGAAPRFLLTRVAAPQRRPDQTANINALMAKMYPGIK